MRQEASGRLVDLKEEDQVRVRLDEVRDNLEIRKSFKIEEDAPVNDEW